jgi:glycosyltransferase involved in cell wall biosynthesis
MALPGNIVANTRSLGSGMSGVQRYTAELCTRLGRSINTVSPTRPLHGILGHLWEQMRLPALVGSRLLWSPANVGPLLIPNQVVTIHDVGHLDHPEWYNPRYAAWHRWMTPRLVRRVRRVVVVSEFTKRRLVDLTGVNESRVVVVPNGVDRRFYPRSDAEITAVGHSLSLPSARYILSLGSIEPRKNLARLLQAWSSVVSDLPSDVWLVIAGRQGRDWVFSGEKLGDLPPRVFCTGFVSDVHLPALYSGALAMAYLSVYEGFGLPPLEAMACGTIAITGNLASLPEVVGSAGITVDPYNIDAIAEAIAYAVTCGSERAHLRQRVIERSRAFRWENAAARTLEILTLAGAS